MQINSLQRELIFIKNMNFLVIILTLIISVISFLVALAINDTFQIIIKREALRGFNPIWINIIYTTIVIVLAVIIVAILSRFFPNVNPVAYSFEQE